MRIKLVTHLVDRLLAGLFLVVLSGSAPATPQPPPILCIDGSDCVETAVTNPDPDGNPDGGYTLASIGSVPFAYNTPIPPNISSEVTVTPATIEANKVNGRRIVLSPGNYGNQDFSTQDQEIVFQEGVAFGFLTVRPSAARLVFRGSSPRVGSVGYIEVGNNRAGAATDIVFDGINQIHIQEPGDWPRQSNSFVAKRIAVINSSFLAYKYLAVSFSSPGARLEDAIFANNNMVDEGTSLPGSGSAGPSTRFSGSIRLIFVDNRVVGYRPDGYHNFRIHAQPDLDAEDFYIARNQFEGTGHYFIRKGESGAGNMELLNIHYVDNEQYNTMHQPINVHAGSSPFEHPTTFTLTGNNLYQSGQAWPTQPAGFTWTISGNTVNASATPPVWQFR